MAEGSQFTIISPDFDHIRYEAGQHTSDGILTVWEALNSEAQSRRRGVREAIERMAPKEVILAPAVNQNDLDTQFATVLRFDGAGAVNITGLQQRPEPTAIFLCVLGAGTITLKNQDAASIARNRIVTASGGDVAIATNEQTLLWYLNSRWRQLTWA